MAGFLINKQLFLVSFLLVGWFVFFIPQCTESIRISCGGIAEEGTQHKLQCLEMPWHWYRHACGNAYNVFLTANDNKTTATCNFRDDISSSPYPQMLETKCRRHSLLVTITKTSRISPFNMETNWTCDNQCDHPRYEGYERNKDDTCSLKIFAKAETPTCGVPVLNPDTLELTVTCVTERVYPQALCLLYLGKEINETGVFTQVDVTSKGYIYKHSDLNETVPYYQTECTITWPLASLIENGKFFKVKMYPEDRGGPKNGVDSDIMEITLANISKQTTNSKEIIAEDDAEGAGKNDTVALVAMAVSLAITTSASVVLLVMLCRMSKRRNNSENMVMQEVETSTESAAHGHMTMKPHQREEKNFETSGQLLSKAEAYDKTVPGNVYFNQPEVPEEESLYETVQGAEVYENL